MVNDISIKVISLIQDKEKQKAISKEFARNEIFFSFFDATYGKNIPSVEYYHKMRNSHFLFNRHLIISPSEVGCMLSHYNVLKNFISSDSNNNWLIVLEDDVMFDAKFKFFLSTFKGADNIDNIYILGGQQGLKSRHLLFGRKFRVSDFSVKKVFPWAHRWMYRTCSYMVNKDSAKKMVEVYEKYNIVADDWSFIFKKGNFKNIYYIDLIKHPEDLLNSAIHNERINYK
jgi:GR25 family glycosyltransferase involved in LPS biosynthesis